MVFRVGLLTSPPEFDELYHLLAARGWMETGAPTILDGEYNRGRFFTRAAQWLFLTSGTDDLATGRLISIAAGSLLPTVLFLWLARVAGLAVGLIAAGLAILWPQGLIESQLMRFYALHVLCFFVGSAAFYNMITTSGPQRWKWAVATIGGWAIATSLQITTIIGIGAALVWAGAVLAHDMLLSWRARATLATAVLVTGAAAFVAAANIGLLEQAWAFYRWTPGHAAETQDYIGFYHANLRNTYGALWYSTPVISLIALWFRPRLAGYCLMLFVSLFVVLSFGGMKAFRYLSFAMPMLLAIWAIALTECVARIGNMMAGEKARRAPLYMALTGLLFTAALFATSSFGSLSLARAWGEGVQPRGDWRDARQIIGDWLPAPFTVTTRELHMLAYVGPYDLLISSSRITELNPPKEFGVDPRTGRPVIGSVETIAMVLKCKRQGVLITSPHWWFDRGWGKMMEQLFEDTGLNFETRTEGAVMAVRWFSRNHQPAICNGLPI